ncbi:hypothetical protein HS088_TW09G00129 [Tripterygium wilfordii]|uniref:Uncharacterized protein n=1 Tax=Tripterygium wilfordii TaxID=458696 RepID=A0A7J7D6U6_TRIWF|nr:hypothetical protein HS088_TW09G00129 [Tripterygium wilfordii]
MKRVVLAWLFFIICCISLVNYCSSDQIPSTALYNGTYNKSSTGFLHIESYNRAGGRGVYGGGDLRRPRMGHSSAHSLLLQHYSSLLSFAVGLLLPTFFF